MLIFQRTLSFHLAASTAPNEQINVEYSMSYVYHAMFAYFDRDNIVLKGLAKKYTRNPPKIMSIQTRETHSMVAEHFNESEFLEEQAEAIKKISEFVAQQRMVGKGHGVWHFDKMLLHEGNAP